MPLRYKVLDTDDRPLKNEEGGDLIYDTEAEAAAVRDKVLGRRVVFCDDEGKILGH